jgi:p24 family protein delta-1
MAQASLLRSVCSILLLLASLASALKFELPAVPKGSHRPERCVRNFVAKDTLVVVTAIVSGNRGDGQSVNIVVRVLFPVSTGGLGDCR